MYRSKTYHHIKMICEKNKVEKKEGREKGLYTTEVPLNPLQNELQKQH